MSKRDEELRNRLLILFKDEARERVSAITSILLGLESGVAAESRAQLLENAFREAHSLKGAAHAVTLNTIEAICRSLESAFAALKRQEIEWNDNLLVQLQNVAVELSRVLATADFSDLALSGEQQHLLLLLDHAARPHGGLAHVAEASATKEPPSIVVTAVSTNAAKTPPPSTPPAAPSGMTAFPLSQANETLRISVDKLDTIFVQTEELISCKIGAEELLRNLRGMVDLLDEWQRHHRRVLNDHRKGHRLSSQANRENGGKRQELTSDYLKWLTEMQKKMRRRYTSTEHFAESQQRMLSSQIGRLQEDVKSALMLPCTWLFELFPAMVFDLAKKQAKDIDFELRGETIEIDKRIMEEMRSPFLHLLRNCIDHGIESPKKRAELGKSKKGKITITVTQKGGGRIEFLIRDDGSGIDVDKIKAMAIKQSLLTVESANALSDDEALDLVFESGLSTSSLITDLSGRGLGMAIVREKIFKLGGSVAIKSERNVGTSISMLLPLALSTFRGLLISVADRQFMMPVSYLERVLRLPVEQISRLENRESVIVAGKNVALVRLAEVLGLPLPRTAIKSKTYVYVLLVSVVGKQLAFLVDEIHGDQEISVKSLGPQLLHVNNIMGATVLGDGRVLPILDISDLMKSALRAGAANGAWSTPVKETPQRSLLVVEDSITSRAMLKNILETAGYNVNTAADGQDAWEALQQNAIDLIVSDVEMPNLNGFDLTEKVRADKKLAQTPVILVTALHSDTDRMRGMDVGANAYIVKSSFDQDSLLDAVQRLV